VVGVDVGRLRAAIYSKRMLSDLSQDSKRREEGEASSLPVFRVEISEKNTDAACCCPSP